MNLSIVLLFSALGIVKALTINTPSGWKGNQTNTVTWTTSPGDPSVFDIELVSIQFHSTFAVANSVNASLGTLSFELPQITQTGPGFTLEFHDVQNIANVFATSQSFSIEQQDASAVTQSSTGTDTSSSSGTATGPNSESTGTRTGASSTGTDTLTGASSTGATSETATSTTTAAATSPTSVSVTTTNSASSASNTTSTTTTSGALGLDASVFKLAVVVFAATAGAAIL